MNKVSVIIPARDEKYLQNTIDDLFSKAKGEIEIIVVLDGYWPVPILKDDPRLILIHRGEPKGMRDGINSAANIAKGKYLLKTDAHCIFGEGYDEILKADCESNWLVVPSRYSLNVEKWERRDKPPVEYNFLTFPYVEEEQFGTGFHGKKWVIGSRGPNGWYAMENNRKDIPIDEVIIFQGSCWFMPIDHFFNIDCLDTIRNSFMFQEAPELSFKTWLSEGRVVVNKKTWYAHWHKSNGDSQYHLSYKAKKDVERMSVWYWMNDKWPKATRKMEWLIDKFMPLPDWPENWREEKERYEKENPEQWGGKNIRIFDEKGHEGLLWQ